MSYDLQNYPPEWLCRRCGTISSDRVEKGCPTCGTLPWWRRRLKWKNTYGRRSFPCGHCGGLTRSPEEHACEERTR